MNESIEAFVSQPTRSAATVKNPFVISSAVPVALAPVTVHRIMWLAVHGETGVQVSNVFPLLQAGEVVLNRGGTLFKSMKDATVAVVFMAWLKLKTTGAVGETPLAMFAGTVETTVGCACANPTPASKTASGRNPTR